MPTSHRAAPSLIATTSLLLGLLAPACQRAPERSVEGVPRSTSSQGPAESRAPVPPPVAPAPAEPVAAEARRDSEEKESSVGLGVASVAPSATSVLGAGSAGQLVGR